MIGPDPTRPAEPPLALRVLLPVLVAVAVACAFLPALDAGFVDFDDQPMLVENDRFRGFGAENLAWMWTTRLMGHWQPLAWMTLAVDDAISGRDPSSYHRTSILLHALDAVLVYFVALRLFGVARARFASRPVLVRAASAVAALAFGLHPLRVESVAWVTERRDVVSTAFLLGALLAYLAAFAPGEVAARSRAAWALSVALLLLSLCSKAWGITFVAVLVVIDVWPLSRLPPEPWRWLGPRSRVVLAQKIPYAILCAAAAVVARWAIEIVPGMTLPLSRWSVVARVVQACYGLSFYVAKTLWPADLAVLVERPAVLDPFEPRFLLGIAGALALALAAWVLRRRAPAVTAAIVVFAIVVSPVLGFSQVGPQLAADRYSYLACISFALLAGGAAAHAWTYLERPLARAALVSLGAAVMAALAAATWRQSKTWKSSRTLWEHAIAAGRPSAIAHRNLGLIEKRDGRPLVALSHFEAAVALHPDHGESWMSLARSYADLERFEESERAWREAARCTEPAYLAWMRLGRLYQNELGRLDDAIEAFRAAVLDSENGPIELRNPNTHLALGSALAQRGDREEARVHLEIAARYAKTYQEALRLLAELR